MGNEPSWGFWKNPGKEKEIHYDCNLITSVPTGEENAEFKLMYPPLIKKRYQKKFSILVYLHDDTAF